MEHSTSSGQSLDVLIEGLLFYKGSPMRINEIAKVLTADGDTVSQALVTLQQRLQSGATRLLCTETEVQLVTAPALDTIIEGIRRDELKRDIGRAGAETLAIVLYRGPVTRAEIDRIRGVNSAFILRNLLVRGLITRETEGKTHRFAITTELLAHLGITHKSELPDYQSILDQLDAFETAHSTEDSATS
jgi:segregation and condensation protein B